MCRTPQHSPARGAGGIWSLLGSPASPAPRGSLCHTARPPAPSLWKADACCPLLPQKNVWGFIFAVPCPHRAGEGEHELSLAAARGSESGLERRAPGGAALPPLPGAAQESRARLLPGPALRRPLIPPPLMLISEVVHRSSLICYPGGVSFRANEREPGGSARASRALREHRQPPKAAACAQQVPGQADSPRPGSCPRLLPGPAASPPAHPPKATVPLARGATPDSPSCPCTPLGTTGHALTPPSASVSPAGEPDSGM